MKSRKKRILGILFSLALMVGMICAMSQAVYAGGYEKEWDTDQTISESVEYNGIRITNSITIKIEKDVTLTVNGSIAANGKTLTVKGPGKLVVNGAGGYNGISGNINVKGAYVEIIGKPGSDATQAGFGGTDGGWAVYGNVVVYDGSIKAIGGNGGNGAGDGDGGYGGFGIYGDLTVTGGSASVHGGNAGIGGAGGENGQYAKAVDGTLSGTTLEESNDGEEYTTVSGSASERQYVRATGTEPVSVKLDVGADHADQFGSEMLTVLENAVDPCDVSISGNVITFTGVKASMTETELWNIISDVLYEKGFSSTIDDNELWFRVGFRSFDKYATFDDFTADINDESHEAFVSEGFTLYLLWQKAYTKLDIDNGNPICGKKSYECQPTMPDGFEVWYEGYTWTDQNEKPVAFFKGDNEYIYYNEYKLEDDGVLWKYFINPEDFSVSIKDGDDLGSGADIEDPYFSYDEIIVTFKATADHDWDEGTETKKPTTTTEGEMTYRCKAPDCGATKTEAIPKLKASVQTAKVKAKGKRSLVIAWNKIPGADGYDIFFAKCNNNGKKIVCKKVKSIKGNNTFKWIKSGLKKGTSYKSYVKAYTMKDGKKTYISKSPIMHAYTGNVKGNYTNAKAVKVKKTRVTLNKGKTFKIKAKVTKVKKNKKLMPKKHVKTLRYRTSDKTVATVTKGGKISAKGKGTCKVIVFAHNGVSKTIKVTVK